MKSVNKVTLLGAVGKDPETRYTASGMAVASFSLATSTKQKDKDEITMWHNCVAFGKLAEIVSQYIAKGAKLYLEGTIQYQEYEKDGEKRLTTKIVVNDISMLSPASGNGNQTANQGTQRASGSGTSRAKAPPAEAFDDDSIPF